MKTKNKIVSYPPLIFNLYKPTRISSNDFIYKFKKVLPRTVGKIGHFGTLDPFASGVLMVGIAGAARLNEHIHELLPKTYLAIGKLGIETETGDYTGKTLQTDDSEYSKTVIASFSKDFIHQRGKEKFLGSYWQAPPMYSAAKFNGKRLHEWAREGIEIKKPQVERTIHFFEVVRYQFPYVALRVTSSSGTYIRTLFNDFAKELGTIGTLIALRRESVGLENYKEANTSFSFNNLEETDLMKLAKPVEQVLKFNSINLDYQDAGLFMRGGFLKRDEPSPLHWVYFENKLVGLGKIEDGLLKPHINFTQEIIESSSLHPTST